MEPTPLPRSRVCRRGSFGPFDRFATHSKDAPEKRRRWVSKVQTQADEMMKRHGFLGVPREKFEAGGRAH